MMDCICLCLAVPVSNIAQYFSDQGEHLFLWVGPRQVSDVNTNAWHSPSGFIAECILPLGAGLGERNVQFRADFQAGLGVNTEPELVNA
jgi:hypothetical protein